MTNKPAITPSTIQQWITDKLDLQVIKEMLLRSGYDETAIENYVKEFKKLKYAKRQYTGFVLLGVGAFLGFVSCLLTILNPFPDWYNAILYGFTSMAILIVFTGLYFVLE